MMPPQQNENDEEMSVYVHFDTTQQCIDFMQYMETNLKQYKVGHTCCDGKGCEVFNIDNSTGHRIKKEFLALSSSLL